MLTIRTMPLLLKIAAKLDLQPVIDRLKTADIFDEVKSGEEAVKQLNREKLGLLGAEIITEILPQLGKIADDIPPLVAAYKNISVEEAYNLDAIEVIKEIINDEGIVSFFKTALQKNVEPKA